jgi:hypothetical protein
MNIEQVDSALINAARGKINRFRLNLGTAAEHFKFQISP